MNYEERYKQAIEAAKRELHCCGSLDCDAARQIFRLFPELKESEDERIRKGLIKGLSAMRDIHNHQTFSDDAININDAIAWLEKQGEKKDTITPQWMVDFLKEHRRHFATPMDYDEKKETDGKLLAVIKWLEGNPQLEQKPTWSEEDEYQINTILHGLDLKRGLYKKEGNKVEEERYSTQYNWLNSLKDRVQPQQKQEWSEYDKIQLSEAIQMIEANGTWIRSEDAVKKVSNWLKSLKPQNRWKPSEEQMSMLLAVLNDSNNITAESVHIALKSLYNDLKKL